MVIFTVTTSGGWFTYYLAILEHLYKKEGKMKDIVMKIQLLQNGRFFLRLFPFLGFYRFCKVGNGNRFPRLCPLLKICNGGRLRRIVDKPVKIVVVLLYGVLDVL